MMRGARHLPGSGFGVGCVWLLLSASLSGPDLLAQSGSSAVPSLDRIAAAADAGRADEAREALGRWFAARADRVDRRDLVRARFLRARLTSDADSARTDYLWIAIDGGGEHGAAAWLRLAQLDLAAGDPDRALQDLARLRADYAGELVPTSWLWTGFAYESAGRLEDACRSWERAARLGSERGDADARSRAREAADRCASGQLRLTLQVGAFRARSAAEELRGRLVEADFDARVERSGGLHRVRVGRFGAAEAAREAVERLQRAGFSAVVMSEDS